MNVLEKWLDRVMSFFVVLSLIVLTVVTFLSVVSRYVFNLPIAWSLDVIRISFIYLIFIAMPILIRTNDHINIDVLVSVLPPKVKKGFEVFSLLFVLAFSVVLFYSGLIFTLESSAQRMSYIQLQMSYVYLVFPVSSFLAVMYSCIRLYWLIKPNKG